MKKRTVILLIVFSVLAFQIFCAVGFCAGQKYLMRRDYQYFCERITENLQQDTAFIEAYGGNVKAVLDPDEKIVGMDGYVKDVCCLIRTDTGVYKAVAAYDTKNDTCEIRQITPVTDKGQGT